MDLEGYRDVLHIHRAERADGLVEALGDLMAVPLDDPMTPEVIAVPTHGVERWLSQRLSARLGTRADGSDGVCANVDFPYPGRLIGRAVAAAEGVDRDRDPWLPERSVWPLLGLIDECLPEPWLTALAAHLGVVGTGPEAEQRTGRFGIGRHIADLYDHYAVHRPEMLCAWAAGEDTDGANRRLGDDAAWQAELWRRLRRRIGADGPAERLGRACARMAADPNLLDLPPRLSLFGLTRLPASYLRVLSALATGRDVHLMLLHPSPALWARVADRPQQRGGPVVRRADDDSAHLPRNPLLASWAHDAREMQIVLTAGQVASDDDHRPVPGEPTNLLQQLQADIRADRPPRGAPLPCQDDLRLVLDPNDHSLQIHACHGLARQVEVLRDAILHRLGEDPSLEARDIIVMCPDIETFAPLIHATFGAGELDDGDDDGGSGARAPDLRVRLADRSLRQTNPVLGVVAELLELASARLTVSQVLDLSGREPVRRRFRLDDDDLSQVQEWVAATGVRWGLDAAHRAPFKLDWLEANSWRAGLDRLLLGVAMAEDEQRLLGGVLPLDDVDSGDIDLAGRFAELIDRLDRSLTDLSRPKAVDGWAASIAAAADLLTVTTPRDGWQREQLDALLEDVVVQATADHTAAAPSLTLPEIRSLLADRLRGRPTRANFRTGHLTICTLVPMRSVPHRIVCLLGLDDGVFPRKTGRDGDDILLIDPHVGDRDSRSEDRQLLLDAVLAAVDGLVITYAGRDERTNAVRPPAVPVGELLDVVDRTARTAGAPPVARAGARDQVVIHHPLQPFDPRNFTVGGLVPAQPWSFDAVALDGARALTGARVEPSPFLTGPLPAKPADPVEVEQLVRFVQHPAKAFLRQRLGVSVGDYSDEVSDALPVELDKLEEWGVGQRLLDARLAGAGAGASVAAEMARGRLPTGAFAQPVLDQLMPNVEEVVTAASAVVGGGAERGSIEINLRLSDGRSLVGTVADVSGSLLRAVTFSRVGPKHRLAAWVRFLALTAAHPERSYQAATVGRVRFGASRRFRVTVSHLAAFEGDRDTRAKLALHNLEELVELYDRGMSEPLPLYCRTSAAYVEALTGGKDPVAAARAEWESSWNFPKEDKDLEHQLVLGGTVAFDTLLEAPPGRGEEGDGWAAGETTRFGRYACRLWDGLLTCEELAEQ